MFYVVSGVTTVIIIIYVFNSLSFVYKMMQLYGYGTLQVLSLYVHTM